MPPVDEAKEELERHWQAVALRGGVERGDVEQVDEILAEGANPNYKMTDGSHWTILMLASYSGHAPLVERLTRGGRMPKIEDRDPHGVQALALAAHQGHIAVLNSLLKKGADANATSEDGETPLMLAAAQGHAEVVLALLAAGANATLADKNDMTAIKKAARWGHIDCLKALLPKVPPEDTRQLRHCLLFGRLYGHPDIMAEIEQILEPPEADPSLEDAEDRAVARG
mmetsp:Transcript_15298/g.30074  ORF Transcript_15298/g.30074 Transcript_15298/m.30074 type:complete len:227 (-) Transcript_15298:110-790(-)|eukprot:CAMPEP_0172832740 /NCGR_PEP_ID=MMETSP1075-20121228/23873_1 /TAXON_ID=2916 /ORGANISM="Ceratium fusus, Strain PA161109" /LENGTH=226 /DNA_ID=CAMNT_0013675391 /DNA_START=39 /DNA_END=719 /DNA_ORIENTATION=-